MSDTAHLLIPFASCGGEECLQALRQLELPRLEQLLARFDAGPPEPGDARDLCMPHERVLARACGLPTAADGRIPWAAWRVLQAGTPPGRDAWACITPCHWHAAADHVAMDDPQRLALDERESRALLAALRPFFEQDGIALEYAEPALWFARGELFRELPAASLDRVIGRAVDAWLPRVPAARPVRRLQQEVQMLLYTSEANDQRQQRGLLPVNSFWVSGTGALPKSAVTALPPRLRLVQDLRAPALAGDWAAWSAAWRRVDEREVAPLLDARHPVTLTLCGDCHARSWTSAGAPGFLKRVSALFAAPQARIALEAL